MPTYPFACFGCRKVYRRFAAAKVTVCPQCGTSMTMTGPAFRAPKQTNVRQWQKVQLLIQAGFRFYKNGGPKPRTLREVPAFLTAHLLSGRSRGARLIDDFLGRTRRRLSGTRAHGHGRVKHLKHDGRIRFELLGRELTDWSRVILNVDGQWQEGIFKCTGDGMKVVAPRVEVQSTGSSPRRIFVTKLTVLRWPD